MQNENSDQSQINWRTHFKEIFSGIRACFSLTAHERLIIMLVLALFLFGLALRWRHLSRERADRYELPARNAPATTF